jgi:uncharacterized protein YndB with AHSA1/START domain
MRAMGSFQVERSTTIAAPPERVHGLIEDFHRWREWSPWEDLDPDLKREFSGAEKGAGAHYAWEGNRKAGRGSMEISENTPDRVALRIRFEKPFKAENHIAFLLTPAGEGTDVTWRMSGEHKGVAGVFGRVMGMDRLVGRDFEKGLVQMKAAAERET